MTAIYSLPEPNDIAQLLTMLLEKEVSVTAAGAGNGDLQVSSAAGVYVDQQ